ncbi:MULTISPECIES: hypothetical protein [unclassified Micromonospora]|uniref:hypothetical protein n=1 Tax=unclassified Micromonospora TaxID=2617518 RepID=UPI00362C8A44
MRDLLHLERLEQAETLLKPQRIELPQQLAEPPSGDSSNRIWSPRSRIGAAAPTAMPTATRSGSPLPPTPAGTS